MKKLTFLFKAPKDCYLAYSGGVDSAVLLHTLLARKVNVTLLTIDHNNAYGKEEVAFCKETALIYGIGFRIFNIPEYDGSSSLEGFWSVERDKIFQSMDKPVLTAHHLDDAVSWYVMSSMQGCSKLINYQRGNILRPLLITCKKDIIDYANAFKIKYISDPTNLNPKYCLRNKVNIELMGSIKNCFPGISRTVRRLIVKKEKPY